MKQLLDEPVRLLKEDVAPEDVPRSSTSPAPGRKKGERFLDVYLSSSK
jgi:hypothetical protein